MHIRVGTSDRLTPQILRIQLLASYEHSAAAASHSQQVMRGKKRESQKRSETQFGSSAVAGPVYTNPRALVS